LGDVLRFTNPKWSRLEPIWPQSWEINCVVVYNYLGWEVPRAAHLSPFEHRWLDHLKGHRHREVYDYLESIRDFNDARVTTKLYGPNLPKLENVRWPDARYFKAG